jgi:RHS repeat-associated protein
MTTSTICAIDRIPRRQKFIDTYEYDAYGNKVNSTGTTPNNYLYQGEEWDSDLGLYYLRARYMNPLTGRFLSRDPEDGDYSNPASLHKYLYANGDPVNAEDPTGREALVATAEIDLGEAIKNALAATAVTAGVACILNEATELLHGLYTDLGAPILSITQGFCRARVKKLTNGRCRWKAYVHPNGTPNHNGVGPFVGFGDEGSCAASCAVARREAYAAATLAVPGGWHIQHEGFSCRE